MIGEKKLLAAFHHSEPEPVISGIGEGSNSGSGVTSSIPANNSSQPSILSKRGFEQTAASDAPPAKRPTMGVIRQAGNAKQVSSSALLSVHLILRLIMRFLSVSSFKKEKKMS